MADRIEARTSGEGRSPAPLVRRATPADARAIAEITVAGWQAAYRGLMPDEFLDRLSVAAREAGWRTWLENGDDGGDDAWMAEIDGQAVGFVSSGPPRDDDVPAPAAEVYAIYVAPSEWRRGAGRALLEAATAEWWRRGTATLVLWVLEGNGRGRSFYEALGWRPDGNRRDFELGDLAVPEVRYRLVRPA
jgi:GNAT superfamily N-acetyltransferase